MPKENNSLKAHYLEQLELAPDIIAMIGEGTLVLGEDGPTIRSASDYSYAASYYAGPHYRLAGDAAGRTSSASQILTVDDMRLPSFHRSVLF